jgi:hypothetical protein
MVSGVLRSPTFDMIPSICSSVRHEKRPLNVSLMQQQRSRVRSYSHVQPER